jgi:hypothetical protein
MMDRQSLQAPPCLPATRPAGWPKRSIMTCSKETPSEAIQLPERRV